MPFEKNASDRRRSRARRQTLSGAHFTGSQPPLLAVWGKNDLFFLPTGAQAFKRDNPKAEVKLFDTGHFALETHVRGEIQPADFARYLASVIAGLGIQAANGATRAELRRVASIALRCIEAGVLGSIRREG